MTRVVIAGGHGKIALILEPGFELTGGLFNEVHGMRLAFQQFRPLTR